MRFSLAVYYSICVCLWASLSHAMSSSANLKRILVTGGNKGIGRAICERLLTEYPDTYVILGSRDKQRGQEAAESILKQVGDTAKDRLEVVQINTAQDDSVQAAAQVIESSGKPLYGIINNAGVSFAETCVCVSGT